MTRYAEYFATVSENGDILNLVEALPPHELGDNQVMLTKEEYNLLQVARTISRMKQLMGSVEWKIGELHGRKES